MKRIRRLLLFFSLLGIVGCVVLLLNFTAPNPTGRRYSSEAVTLSENRQQKGITGERILSNDLQLPNNNQNGKQCLCGTNVSPPISKCQICIVRSDKIANYRIPDFITNTFIADSKNTEKLIVTHKHDYEQIMDMAVAANQKRIPLWIFVRVNTYIDQTILTIVRSTGGDIVPYFAVPGYVDPIDQAATTGLLIFGGIFAWMLAWESLAGIRLRPAGTAPMNPPSHKTAPAPRPHSAITRAEKAVKSTEAFIESNENSKRKIIDAENTRIDDDLV
jgi:hypothetical protein